MFDFSMLARASRERTIGPETRIDRPPPPPLSPDVVRRVKFLERILFPRVPPPLRLSLGVGTPLSTRGPIVPFGRVQNSLAVLKREEGGREGDSLLKTRQSSRSTVKLHILLCIQTQDHPFRFLRSIAAALSLSYFC